jgi:hypothetical protein
VIRSGILGGRAAVCPVRFSRVHEIEALGSLIVGGSVDLARSVVSALSDELHVAGLIEASAYQIYC